MNRARASVQKVRVAWLQINVRPNGDRSSYASPTKAEHWTLIFLPLHVYARELGYLSIVYITQSLPVPFIFNTSSPLASSYWESLEPLVCCSISSKYLRNTRSHITQWARWETSCPSSSLLLLLECSHGWDIRYASLSTATVVEVPRLFNG